MGLDVLPKWERLLYWIGGVTSLFYCIFAFYKETKENISQLELQPGVEWLGGKKDLPDMEWNSKSLLCLLSLLIVRTVICQLLYMLQLKIWQQKLMRLLYDVVSVAYLFGARATLLCVVQAVIMYLVTFQRFTALAWFVGLAFTSTLNFEWIVVKQLEMVGYSLFDNILFFSAIAYVHIRLISASIEIIKCRNLHTKPNLLNKKYSKSVRHCKGSKETDAKESKNSELFLRASVIDFMSYIFYFPIFFLGPILTFDEFLPQQEAFYTYDRHHYDFKDIFKRIFRLILYAGFVEFQFHFMYLTSVQNNWKLISNLSVPAVVGLGVWQGQFFHLKYHFMFGLGGLFSVLDGLTPPQLPACISWVYSFSDMWKYFDVGLYNFIKKYIYIPWGGSQAGFARQICGVTLAFAFIYHWHGTELPVFIWCVGNLVIILLEIGIARLESSKPGSDLKSYLGPAGVQRIRGLFATPFYLASALQVMYFFFSMNAGNAMVDKLARKASWKTLCFEYVFFYCAIQNAMLIRKWVIQRRQLQ